MAAIVNMEDGVGPDRFEQASKHCAIDASSLTLAQTGEYRQHVDVDVERQRQSLVQSCRQHDDPSIVSCQGLPSNQIAGGEIGDVLVRSDGMSAHHEVTNIADRHSTGIRLG